MGENVVNAGLSIRSQDGLSVDIWAGIGVAPGGARHVASVPISIGVGRGALAAARAGYDSASNGAAPGMSAWVAVVAFGQQAPEVGLWCESVQAAGLDVVSVGARLAWTAGAQF